MSWDVFLRDEDGEECQVRPFMGGGTVVVNPETMQEIPQVEANLNVTYNYSGVFSLAAKAALYELGREHKASRSGRKEIEAMAMLVAWYEEGFRSLDGASASRVEAGLRLMIEQLDPRNIGPGENDNYWAPTPANAARALRTLLEWCEQVPDGTFMVY